MSRFSQCSLGISLVQQLSLYLTNTWGFHKRHMEVNFLCQLDWAAGHPDVCLDVTLGASTRVFLNEIHI